jgi:hypothetical protein
VADARKENMINKERTGITYSRESALTHRHGLETFHDKLPADIKVSKNKVETELCRSELMPTYCHETKVSSPTIANMIMGRLYAASGPRCIWMCTSLYDHKCMFWELLLAGIIKQCDRCKGGEEEEQQGEDTDNIQEGVLAFHSQWLEDVS